MNSGNNQVKIGLIQKVRIFAFGYVPTSKQRNPGWNGHLQFYAFICPVHGLVESYPNGYNQILHCPKCLKIGREKQSFMTKIK